MVMVAHTLLIPAQGMREKPSEPEANLIYTGSSRITRVTYSVSKFQNPKINKKPNTNNKNKMSREQGFQLSTGVLCLLPGIPPQLVLTFPLSRPAHVFSLRLSLTALWNSTHSSLLPTPLAAGTPPLGHITLARHRNRLVLSTHWFPHHSILYWRQGLY